MVKVVGEVAIDVTADIGPLVKQMKRGEAALDGLQGAAGKAAHGLQSFGDKATNLGVGLSAVSAGVAAVAGAAFAMTKGVASAGDAAAKAARGAGVSGKYFQEMGFALDQVAAISNEELSAGMSRVTRLLGDAKLGSKSATAAFEQIGISQEMIASGAVNSEMAFDKLVQKLSETTDPAAASSIAMDLLGKSGADLGPKLAGSAAEIAKLREQANALGIVMSEDSLAASEKFGDQLDAVEKGFQGLGFAIANELLPVFTNALLPAMQDKVIPAMQTMIGHIGNVIEWFSGLPTPVLEAAAVIGTALGAGGPIILGIGLVSKVLGGLIAATGPVGLFIAAATLAVAAWQMWGDDIKAGIGGAVDFITAKFTAFLEFMTSIPDRLREMGAMIIQGLLDGIMERWEMLKAKIYELGAMLPDWMRDILDIHSPSRVFHEIGGYIGEGLANGIAASHGMVNQAIGALSNTAVITTQGMANQVLGVLGDMFEGSKEIAAAQALVNAWAGASEALKMPFPANIFAFGKALALGMSAVRSIQGVNKNGGGGAGGGGAAASAGGVASGAASAPAQQAPAQTVNVTVQDMFSESLMRALAAQLNAAGVNGVRLNVRAA